jgi:hypothetical protein
MIIALPVQVFHGPTLKNVRPPIHPPRRWISLATLVDSPAGALGAILLASLSAAVSDVVVDSIAVR